MSDDQCNVQPVTSTPVKISGGTQTDEIKTNSCSVQTSRVDKKNAKVQVRPTTKSKGY